MEVHLPSVSKMQSKFGVVKKIATLGVLYFVQGLPYGFQDKFIPAHLRTSGLSHTKLSLMKLLLLPWLCKAAFAPLLDMFWTKWFWLLYSLCSLSVVALSGALLHPESFVLVSVWLFLLNLLSAVQDIAVDGLALKILRDSEIGHGNTAQVIGYKLGALSGGGVLFWINVYYGWSGLCFSLFCFYLASVLTILPLHDNRPAGHAKVEDTDCDTHHSDVHESEITKTTDSELRIRKVLHKEEQSHEGNNVQAADFCKLFVTLFYTKGTVALMCFLLIYKLGERGSLSSFPLFLIDQGVSIKQLSIWSGMVGQSSSLLGSICSGWLVADKRKIVALLYYICLARSLPILLQWVIVSVWSPGTSGILYYIFFFFSVLSLISLEFFAGMATTAVFSLMMASSLKAPEAVQGTHYSVLSSIEVSGKLLFSSIIGIFIDWFGLSYIYLILILLSFITVGMLPFLT